MPYLCDVSVFLLCHIVALCALNTHVFWKQELMLSNDRKLFFKASTGWMGEFMPKSGWQAGKRGIRKKLIAFKDCSHLSGKDLKHLLVSLYQKQQQDILEASDKKKEAIKNEKQRLKQLTVNEARDKYLLELKQLGKSNGTISYYSKSINLYIKSEGNHLLKKFDRDHNLNFFEFLRNYKVTVSGRTMAPATQNKHMRHVNAFLFWAYRAELVDKKFFLEKASVPDQDMETYDLDDLMRAKALIEQRIHTYTKPQSLCAAKNMLRAFMMATHTVLRLGAIWSLPLFNIDMERKIIRIREVNELNWHPKKMKYPNKPINVILYDFLKQDLDNRNSSERWYLDRGNGQQWSKDISNISAYARAVFDELGLPRIKPFHHGFRATMITYLLGAGVKPTDVQMLADHTHLATTMKYFNSRKASQELAVSVIPDL